MINDGYTMNNTTTTDNTRFILRSTEFPFRQNLNLQTTYKKRKDAGGMKNARIALKN